MSFLTKTFLLQYAQLWTDHCRAHSTHHNIGLPNLFQTDFYYIVTNTTHNFIYLSIQIYLPGFNVSKCV